MSTYEAEGKDILAQCLLKQIGAKPKCMTSQKSKKLHTSYNPQIWQSKYKAMNTSATQQRQHNVNLNQLSSIIRNNKQ